MINALILRRVRAKYVKKLLTAIVRGEYLVCDSIFISDCGSNREVSEGVPLSRETAGVNTAVLPAQTYSA